MNSMESTHPRKLIYDSSKFADEDLEMKDVWGVESTQPQGIQIRQLASQKQSLHKQKQAFISMHVYLNMNI